jgi:phage terminase large subunit
LPGTFIAYGIDFGFTHSPTAIIQINTCNGEYYVKELFYKIGASNDDIYDFVSKNLDHRALAVADCAEPRTIDYLLRKGWVGLRECTKGPDSVMFGLGLLLQKRINVSRASSHLITEMHEYEWRTNRDGEPMNYPNKINDHAIDAMRYAISSQLIKRNLITN